jgi:two-component system, chemotaxis family, response regulator PixG
MVYLNLVISDELIDEFKICTRLQYNGRLDIKSAKGTSWTFYYRLGRIVWASGGTHSFRRWRRQMNQHCPEFDINEVLLCSENTAIDYWDYEILEFLHKQSKITLQQVTNITESTISELLFDLAQQSNYYAMNCERNQKVILDEPMSFTRTDLSLRYMNELWHSWSEAGLENIYPDLAPVLVKSDILQGLISPTAYNNVVKLMNGKYTLRDLAVKMKQDLLSLSKFLLPCVRKGILKLVEVPDFELKTS